MLCTNQHVVIQCMLIREPLKGSQTCLIFVIETIFMDKSLSNDTTDYVDM